MAPISLDDLLQRIRNEAKRLAPDTLANAQPLSSLPDAEMAIAPLQGDDWQTLLHHRQLSLVDLLGFEGDTFIELAYKALLGRVVDPGGRESMRQIIAAGASRLEIVVHLHFSEEGKKYGRRLGGWSGWLDVIYRVRPRRLRRNLFHRFEQRLLQYASTLVLHVAGYANELARILNDTAIRRLQILEGHYTSLVEHVGELERLGRQNRRDFLYAQLQQNVPPAADAAQAVPNQAALVSEAVLNAYYVAFEDANRGSRDEIRAKQSVYLEQIRHELGDASGLILDIGCGRGEWLKLLGESGYRARGIDLNPVMVEVCRKDGLDVDCIDILGGLARQPDASLAAITSFHVIEHLPFAVLFTALEQAWRALRPGGVLILETPNPENLLVGSHTFYHDFTHRNPVTPAAITFLARYLNFAEVRVERLNPYPESAKVPGIDLLTERVNGHLCGPQDFALIAKKPILDQAARAAA